MSDVPSSAWEAHLQAQQLMTEELRAAHAARIAEKDERIQELLREVSRLRDTGEEEKRRLEEKLEKAQGKYEEDLRTAQEQHSAEKTKLEAQLAELQGKYDRMRQAFQDGIERESRERAALHDKHERAMDAVRETGERDRLAMAREWAEALETERGRLHTLLREQEARHAAERTQLLSRPDALAPALADLATCQRLIAGHLMLPAALQEIASEEQRARAQLVTQLQAAAEAARRVLHQQWEASLKQVRAREAAHAKAIFADRGLSMSELRRIHLGKAGSANGGASYAAEEGLYNLFLALRPGGPVDAFAMRELLKDETNVTDLRFQANNPNNGYYYHGKKSQMLPAAEAYELVSHVLCHLPALRSLRLTAFPPLSTHSLEWVSHLPQCMQELRLESVNYTVAGLRELYRRRGRRTFTLYVSYSYCTNWGELRNSSSSSSTQTKLKAELGGMISWT